MLNVLLVAAGGFVGATARYGLSRWVARRWDAPFPLGTLIANLLGTFLYGLLGTIASRSSAFEALLLIGTAGALTTFSTLIYEVIMLVRSEGLPALLGVLVLHLAGGTASFGLGMWVAGILS